MDIPLSISQVLGFTHSERINTLTVDIITQSAGRDAILQSPPAGTLWANCGRSCSSLSTAIRWPRGRRGRPRSCSAACSTTTGGSRTSCHRSFRDIRMEEGVERAVCDYIAGMTDVYAVECFNAAFIPNPGA
mgnify:CR=1 FL=1